MTRVAGRLVLEQGVVPGRVQVEGERIVAVTPGAGGHGGPYVAPGFTDIHVHGWGGHDAADGQAALEGMAAALLRHGVTSFLPTCETGPLDAMAGFAASVRAFRAGRGTGAEALGFNLEGPFLSQRGAGAQDADHILAPEEVAWERLEPLLDGCRVWTIAPDAPGAVQLVARLAARGIVPSLGHSHASAAEARAAIAAGAASVTHLFNAMSGVDHHAPGLATVALLDDRVRVELIADGLHVHPDLWPLIRACVPASRVVLVTDAISLAGTGEGRRLVGGLEVEVADGACRLVADGRLAGSMISLDAAVRAWARSGAGVAASVGCATWVPLDLIGVRDRGRLAAGQLADLVVLDEDLEVEAVMQGGRWA